jgi:hypothetical protein
MSYWRRSKPQPKPYFKLSPMQFNLTVNDQQSDGFKLSVKTVDKEELNIAKELTEKLIEKISKIEVSVKNYEE